jgi:hypothetical protein
VREALRQKAACEAVALEEPDRPVLQQAGPGSTPTSTRSSRSRTTESIPALVRRLASSVAAGPAPSMQTWVLTLSFIG